MEPGKDNTMSLIPAIVAVVAIVLGYQLQRRYESTALYAVGGMIGTALLSLLVPVIFGLEVIYLFGVFFAIGFGASILYKQKMRAAARTWARRTGYKV